MVAPLRFVSLRVYPILVTESEMLSGSFKKRIGRVARFRRSRSGLISAITTWLHFADHKLARFRRSEGGSISAITDWHYSTDQ
jgi:hypothetical protein